MVRRGNANAFFRHPGARQNRFRSTQRLTTFIYFATLRRFESGYLSRSRTSPILPN